MVSERASLGQVQLLEARGEIEEALAAIEECLAHTPTAIDMQQRKARLLKKAGDVMAASDVMDGARHLDLADRSGARV
jgi:N-alpha-acetyltransferase 15/16, NatA auxiliary subunit